jgi:N-acetylneuraminate synthase
VEFLEQFQPPAYKVASFELIDTQLLRAIASTGRAVIASTGMATPREIKVAVDSLRDAGCKQLTLLKCTSAYPAEAKDANLNALPLLREEFGVSVGLSDHTLGTTVGITAVALGIQMIEKHFVLDRSDGAVDAAFSLEPNELRDLVQQVHTAHSSLGAAVLGPGAADLASLQFRRSLYAVCTIAKGAPFTLQNVRSIRPGIGLSPEHFDALLQRRAQRAYSLGDPISEIEVSPSD